MQLSKTFYIFTATVVLIGTLSLFQLDWEASGGNPVLLERFRELRGAPAVEHNPAQNADKTAVFTRPIIPTPTDSNVIIPDDFIAITGDQRAPSNVEIPTPPGDENPGGGHGHHNDDMNDPEDEDQDVDQDVDQGDEQGDEPGDPPGDIDPDDNSGDVPGDPPGDIDPDDNSGDVPGDPPGDVDPDPDTGTDGSPVQNDPMPNQNIKVSGDNGANSNNQAPNGNNLPANDVD